MKKVTDFEPFSLSDKEVDSIKGGVRRVRDTKTDRNTGGNPPPIVGGGGIFVP
jgi:hypothetical protein